MEVDASTPGSSPRSKSKKISDDNDGDQVQVIEPEVKERGQDKLYVFWDNADKSNNSNPPRSPLYSIGSISFATLTLGEFKALAKQTVCSGEADFNMVYNGHILTGDEKTLSSFSIKPSTVVQLVLKRKEEIPPLRSPSKQYTDTQIDHMSMALKTAFLSSIFAKTIESINDNPESLEAIFAVAPELRSDLIGIAIIQSAHMILQYAEHKPLKELSKSRPWVVEALNFIAATVHGEKKPQGSLHRGLLATQLLNPALLEDDEEDMEEGQGQGGQGGRPRALAQPTARPQLPIITREQVNQALSAAMGSSGAGALGLNLGNILRQSAAATGVSAPAPTPATVAAPIPAATNPPTLVSTASGGSAPNILTGDMVARALFDSLNRLDPGAREQQLSAFTNLARQVAASGSTGSTVTPAAAPIPIATPGTTSAPTDSSGRPVEALRQMRELGIQDERLSLLALRVTGGDVNTAADLIFSGWQGEGADDETEGMDEGN